MVNVFSKVSVKMRMHSFMAHSVDTNQLQVKANLFESRHQSHQQLKTLQNHSKLTSYSHSIILGLQID